MKTIVTALLLLVAISVHGQSFEGKIVYQHSFQSKSAALTEEQLIAGMGTRQDYYIKDGSYRSVVYGASLQSAVYVSFENRLYLKRADKETLTWLDAGTNPNEVINIEINRGVTEILGYKCDEAIVKTKEGVEKYYFNSKLGVDPELYVRHRLGNWYEIIKAMRSLPLKSVIELPQYTHTSVATEVVPMKLNQQDFELPRGAKSEKSPY